MTQMIVYDCQSCLKHSSRRLGQMPWICDHCGITINVSSERDAMIVNVPEMIDPEPYRQKTNYTYARQSNVTGIEVMDAI